MAKAGIKVEGIERTVQALRFWGRKHSNARYKVGFRAEYAVFVHEDLSAFHPVGQAKFLEAAARKKANAIAAVTRQAVKRGLPLEEGLRLSAERLKEEAQALTPVDTGFLKNSAYVRREA